MSDIKKIIQQNDEIDQEAHRLDEDISEISEKDEKEKNEENEKDIDSIDSDYEEIKDKIEQEIEGVL